MASYDDVPKINALHQEAEIVGRAIATLDAGGTMTAISVGGAPPPDPPDPSSFFMMGANVNAPPGSVDAAVNDQLRAWLVTRQTAINAELAALGVTDSPPVAVTKAGA